MFLEYLNERYEPMVQDEDLVSALNGLFRLELIYSLTTEQIISGKFLNNNRKYDSYRQLKAIELLSNYYQAALWLNETFTYKYDSFESDAYFDLIKQIAQKAYKHNNVDYAMYLIIKFE